MPKPKIIFEGGTPKINPEPEQTLQTAFLNISPILLEQEQHTSHSLHETIKGPDIDERIQNTRAFENKLAGSMQYGAQRALAAYKYTEEQIANIMSLFQPIFTVWFNDTFKAPNVAANYSFRKYFYESFEKIFADTMSHDFFNLISDYPEIRKQDISITGYTYKKLLTNALKNIYGSIKNMHAKHTEQQITEDMNMYFNLN